MGHLIGGQPVSHVSMRAGLTRDIWSAIAPEIETPRLKRILAVGNHTIPFVRPDEGLFAIDVFAHEYLSHPPPAQFHLLVSPLVMWIWIGGLIVFGGGLLALSPAPGALRRRAALRARVRHTSTVPRWGLGSLVGPGRARSTAVGSAAAASGAAAGAQAELAPSAWESELAALERAREVKYRELRDLELDYATGKLSREDYEATAATLRAEALAILDRLEPEPKPLPGLLQQHDRVSDEQDREEDSPAVEVALHE